MAKFNGKSIAVGIGIGLIIGATLNLRVASKPIELRILEEQALKYYDKVLVDSSKGTESAEAMPSPSPTEAVTPEPTVTVAPTATPAATAAPTETPAVTATPSPTPTPSATPKPTPASAGTEKVVSVSFTVNDYATSETVANYLAKGGIVNKGEFLAELNRRGLSTKIRNGSYTIKKGTSITEIIKILTGR